MNLSEWQKEIGEWGKRKGWDMSKCVSTDPEVKRDFVMHKLALVHTEVSEAVECVRDDAYATTIEEDKSGGRSKPEGMASELADTVIRILHICEAMGIDLNHEIELKMAYNQKRPYMHGRKA